MNPIEILIRYSGKTQKQIAVIVELPESNISDMKKGKRDIPLGKFLEWCKKLDVDIVDVFKEYSKQNL